MCHKTEVILWQSLEKYESPDGLLRLLVDREGDDVMVGFEGFPWHTHADLLTPAYALPKRRPS
jgi:hypothetical protein